MTISILVNLSCQMSSNNDNTHTHTNTNTNTNTANNNETLQYLRETQKKGNEEEGENSCIGGEKGLTM